MKTSIRTLYLYLFSFVGLLVAVIGTIRLIDLGMKVFVFKEADKYSYSKPIVVDTNGNKISPEKEKEEELEFEKQQLVERSRSRQREFSSALSMLAVGIPLYLYHWKVISKEKAA